MFQPVHPQSVDFRKVFKESSHPKRAAAFGLTVFQENTARLLLDELFPDRIVLDPDLQHVDPSFIIARV